MVAQPSDRQGALFHLTCASLKHVVSIQRGEMTHSRCDQMAQQEEPLYDFPEPAKSCQRKLLCPQRGRGSLRSISVLDRLLLTVPVWLQLSINHATALHILQREPPGTFLVRKSRTSQRKVLCVRLADVSVPSFVQQFGIREEQSITLSLETSAISFPDLPRLLSFYCVSRDVLPFPLELPEAIAKAASHKELESISHMGIEFWSSHLNVRGPRETPKTRKDEKERDVATSVSPPPQPDSPNPDNHPPAAPESDTNDKKSDPSATLFHKFCPITTRSPRELDCGSGQGALCFINPLFLQSQNALSRRHMFKRSLKVRVSTETLTQLSPPLAPPPPPPLMPKTKGRCKVKKVGKEAAQPSEAAADDSQKQENPSGAPYFLFETQEEEEQAGSETDQNKAGVREEDTSAQLPAIKEQLLDEYMTPPVINSHSLSPYQSPSVSPKALPFSQKCSPSLSSHDSPSPYQSPSLSPKLPTSLSPNRSPSISPSRSPVPSPPSSPLTDLFCRTPAAPSGAERESGEELLTDRNQDDEEDLNEEESVALRMSAARLEEMEIGSLSGDVEEAVETSPPSASEQTTVQASSEQT
ncbi:ras and Rab interactor 2 [Nematolebias whitei]|uniref:ras and Rab interactor 2 n=1 Tax=Nematolebias whitei TaxID=451745 RepID=UPI00189921F1|nr:ras and Rab interactor 2 [Nematolebias whitei]